MPSSIQFTQHEAQRIFSSFTPGFRADAHGRYRGPATYRGGDNKQALCVDTKQGSWFDFATNEGGDVIAFVQKCHACSFRQACLIIGAIIGRKILRDCHKYSVPLYSEAQLIDAELFATGFRWHLERKLVRLKEDAIWGDKPDTRIRAGTRLLENMNTWSAYDAASYVAALMRTDPGLVVACISEARELQIQLAAAIAGAISEGIAA